MESFFIFLISYITLLSSGFHHLKCQARDRIISGGDPLIDSTNETLVSAGSIFELGFFTPDGNEKGSRYIGIWYYDQIPRTIVWVACRDTPLNDTSGVFRIAEDGNVKLWYKNELFWSVTNVADSKNFNRTLKLLDSGNLIFFDGGPSEAILWQSFDHPTDTFLPGMRMDGKMELNSWISPSDPATGSYTFLKYQNVYSIQKRSTDYWRSRDAGSLEIYNYVPSFVDQMFEGQDQTTEQLFANRRKHIPYKFSRPTVNNSVARVLMNPSGLIQYFVGDDNGGWSLRWSEPNDSDSCSVYEPCGKSANCDSRNRPICQCLPGFRPASKKDWDFGGYSEGCVKEESTTCQDDADKMKQFFILPVSKVESTGALRFDMAQNKADCERECLNDCKCRAYLYRNNSTSRETGYADANCWIWTQDLTNLQIDNSRSVTRISIRAPGTESTRNCQPCFLNQIPYPLSTGPDCGDPLYRSFSCDNTTGVISFLALSVNYQVIGIHGATSSFVIQDKYDGADGCKARNISTQIVKLNPSSPFSVTNPCYTEPGNTNPDVQVRNQIEISWKPPLEPTCNFSGDCKDWSNSHCDDKGDRQKRCYCNPGYKWEGSSVSCANGRPENKKHMKYVIISIVLVAGVVLVLCCFNIIRRTSLFNGKGNEDSVIISHECEGPVVDLIDMEKDSTRVIDVPFYSLDIVLSATDKFSDANKLGRGGFGPVYKGRFPGGQEIAVKRLSSCSGQGIKEFQNEVVLISKLQHRNLVRLLGYSLSKHEKILLYEYMPNRSLDAFIFDQENRLLLDWKKRFDIILGIARGLLYLHQDSRLRVIHRDLKTSNILLDENMNPKISDFGLARIVEGKGAEASTKNVVGTLGYMSPEYALEGKFSTKSDVFSFGVVLLEIVSGKKNTGFYNPEQVLTLLGYAWILWTENKALDLTDPAFVETCDTSQVMKCINIGLLCVQEDPGDRPTMSNVVVMLESETFPLPPPTQPAFVVRRRSSMTSSSTSKPDTISNNELTISMDQGR